MKIKANINIKYNNEKSAKIAYKSLEVDNKGFVESNLNNEKLQFEIESENIGSFLVTADDLIASEILVEDILKNTNEQ